jgi:hypothetical protein
VGLGGGGFLLDDVGSVMVWILVLCFVVAVLFAGVFGSVAKEMDL